MIILRDTNTGKIYYYMHAYAMSAYSDEEISDIVKSAGNGEGLFEMVENYLDELVRNRN